jgi:hypothetical protein
MLLEVKQYLQELVEIEHGIIGFEVRKNGHIRLNLLICYEFVNGLVLMVISKMVMIVLQFLFESVLVLLIEKWLEVVFLHGIQNQVFVQKVH